LPQIRSCARDLQSEGSFESKFQGRLSGELSWRSFGHGLNAGSHRCAEYRSYGSSLSFANDGTDKGAHARPSGYSGRCVSVSRGGLLQILAAVQLIGPAVVIQLSYFDRERRPAAETPGISRVDNFSLDASSHWDYDSIADHNRGD
jgi:hypothetical protein